MFILLSASLFIIRRFNMSHNRFRRFCLLRSIVIFLLVIKAVLPSITQNYIAINSASALPVTTLWLFPLFQYRRGYKTVKLTYPKVFRRFRQNQKNAPIASQDLSATLFFLIFRFLSSIPLINYQASDKTDLFCDFSAICFKPKMFP